MANSAFDKLLRMLSLQQLDWDTDVIRVLAEEQASTYVFDKTHEFVGTLTSNGFVEVTAGGYTRHTLTGATITYDSGTNKVKFTASATDFGTIASGQRIDKFIVYKQTGGNDATPNDDPVLLMIDTTGGVALPILTNGGTIEIEWDADGVWDLGHG